MGEFYIGDFVMTIDGKGIGVSLELSNWSKSSSCSFPCFLKHRYGIYSDCNMFYKRVQIKFADFNIGELLKNLPIANINSSPINHLVRYREDKEQKGS